MNEFPHVAGQPCNLLGSPRWGIAAYAPRGTLYVREPQVHMAGCPVANRHTAISLLGEFQLQFASLLGGVTSDTLSLSPLWSFQSLDDSIPDNPYSLRPWQMTLHGYGSLDQ